MAASLWLKVRSLKTVIYLLNFEAIRRRPATICPGFLWPSQPGGLLFGGADFDTGVEIPPQRGHPHGCHAVARDSVDAVVQHPSGGPWRRPPVLRDGAHDRHPVLVGKWIEWAGKERTRSDISLPHGSTPRKARVKVGADKTTSLSML